MATRIVEWKKPYTWGKAIEIDENKVISLRLRDENNLIIYDEGDDEIYVDLQLKDWIRPTDAFPVWITTGRVLVADDWDITGTLICAKTTSWDNIKLLYGDDGTLWIDNWTWTFKQIYFKSDVDQLLQELRTYVNQQLALKQDKLIAGDNINIDPTTNTISADVPPLSRFLSLWDCATWLPLSFPASVPFDYVTGDHYLVETVWTTNYRPSGSQYTGVASTTVETDPDIAIWDSYIYDGTVWLLQKNSWGGGWGTVVSFSNIVWNPTDNTALANALNAKANATDVNTKTFYLSWTSGATALAEAQEAYDWYVAGKNPIIYYNNKSYIIIYKSSSELMFWASNIDSNNQNSYSTSQQSQLTFQLSSWTVTNVLGLTASVSPSVLSTNVNYSTPYTPLYNGSPATKKYVDNRVSASLEGHLYYLDASATNLGLSSSDMADLCWTLDGGVVILNMMNIHSTISTMKDGYYYVTKYIEQGDPDDTYDIYAIGFGEVYENEICKLHIVIGLENESARIDEWDVPYSFRSDSSASWKTLVKSGTGASSYGWQRPWAYDSTTAPTSPSRGNLWRDRTNNVVKLYDGSNWQTYYPSNAPIQVVSALPATPDANTVYIVTS